MFSKKTLISWIAVFITMMLYGFLVYGLALDSFYKAHTANLVFRAEGEELMQWLSLGQFIMALGFVWVWGQMENAKGIARGLTFGFFMGIFWAGVEMINYAFMPVAQIAMWVSYVADVVMMTVAGGVLSLVWSKLSD